MKPVLLLLATLLHGSLATALPAEGTVCVQCAQLAPGGAGAEYRDAYERSRDIARRAASGRLARRVDGGPSQAGSSADQGGEEADFRKLVPISDKGRADLSLLTPEEKKIWRQEQMSAKPGPEGDKTRARWRANKKNAREKKAKEREEKEAEVRQMGIEGNFKDMDDEQWKKFLAQEGLS